MKTESFASRHIGISEKDIEVMLRKIGVDTLDELINKTIPANIRLKEPLALPPAMTEYEFGKHISELAGKNKLFTTYIGMGWYNTITPAVIQRNVFENPVWYTSYTPYQTEVSQGRLEALMNFQTMVSDLTAMPLANCSLLDEATAAAEAVSMMYALRPRDKQKAGANVVFVDENIFPQTLAVMTTRAIPQGIELRVGKYQEFEPTPEVFACVLQYPNADGNVEDYREFTEKAHATGCKVAVAADLLSLALIVPPGEWGADIVFGTTQRFGSTVVHRQLILPHSTSINEICRDESSVGRKTNTTNLAIAWLYKPVNNTSNAKKRLLISVPHKHCWLRWQVSMPFITDRKERYCTPHPQYCYFPGKRNQQAGVQASQPAIFRHSPLYVARQCIGTTDPHHRAE